MADTTVQGKVERWIVENELPRSFGGRPFSKRKVQLTWGGEFEFDAVSADGAVVVCVSTSCCKPSFGSKRSDKTPDRPSPWRVAVAQRLRCRRLVLCDAEVLRSTGNLNLIDR